MKNKVKPKFKPGNIIRFKGNKTLKGEAETHKIVSYDNELYVFDDGTTDLFCEQDMYELVEHKFVDEAGPKFHEGQWITNGDYTWKIVEVKPLDYILQSQDGNIVDDTISHVDKQFHLWTIQDAKPGDVLAFSFASQNYILIYKGLYEKSFKTIMSVFCFYSVEEDAYYDETDSFHIMNRGEIITPASKEQRDTLMEAMTNAGYVFDFEEKKLKEIEQEQVIDYPDSLPKDNWELIHEFIEKFGRMPKDEDELNVLVEYVLMRRKSAKCKEVDLDKEMGKYLDANGIESIHQIKLLDLAKHFYELGLKRE